MIFIRESFIKVIKITSGMSANGLLSNSYQDFRSPDFHSRIFKTLYKESPITTRVNSIDQQIRSVIVTKKLEQPSKLLS